jgi:glutathione synthase/RimK-type ligase-like ATP-grasp enzyme
MYFSAANPGMKYGGVMGESKFKVLSSIPGKYVPKTIFLDTSTPLQRIFNLINEYDFSFPFIIKPDVGERGRDVEMISSEHELKKYLEGKTESFIIQEFVDYELEFGILYYRLPGDSRGKVSSVVQKGFLFVCGDGTSNIKQLLDREIRARARIDYLKNKYKHTLNTILEPDDKLYLEPIGNHCRGTTFYNANHLINTRLTNIFDEIAQQIDGYFYGRFDIKVPSLDDLYAGENIKILELNGVSSEVAHVYDPDYKLIQAYKDIRDHMKYIFHISKRNHELGIPYDSLSTFLKDLKKHFER